MVNGVSPIGHTVRDWPGFTSVEHSKSRYFWVQAPFVSRRL
jgi:hypothetical protein